MFIGNIGVNFVDELNLFILLKIASIDFISIEKTNDCVTLTYSDKTAEKFYYNGERLTKHFVMIDGIVTSAEKYDYVVSSCSNIYLDQIIYYADRESLYQTEENTVIVENEQNTEEATNTDSVENETEPEESKVECNSSTLDLFENS